MLAQIISVGSELVLGQTVDTNSAWISQQLAAVGITTIRHRTVPDETGPIEAELRAAAGSADVVIVTGGLGPTPDDLTRQALARVLNVELVEDAAALSDIQSFFRRRGMDMPAANRVQALCPQGATLIENSCGTAPGIRARLGRAEVFALPGVPREMREMFERAVRPVLAAQSGGAVVLTATLQTYGAPESVIGERIADLMTRGRNPTVGTTAQDAVIRIRIIASGRDRHTAQALLDADVAELRGRLGEYVYGEGDVELQAAVGALLLARHRTVATAESCTGGLLAKRLTDVPGSSAYFPRGLISYSNDAKRALLGIPDALIDRHGAVSREVAEAMAAGCRRAAATDYALAITGIAGPTGGAPDKPVGLVYVALAGPAACAVRELRLGDHLTRAEIRDRAVKAALDLLRRELLKLS